MKKTLITLMVLAGTALAESTTTLYEPLKESGWTLASERNLEGNNLAKQETTVGKVYSDDPYWKRPYATYDFSEAITISDQSESLTFSFQIDLSLKAAYNSLMTVAFEGSSAGVASTIMMGYGANYTTNNTHFKAAVVNNNTSPAYLFDTPWNSDKYNCTSSTTLGSLTGSEDEDNYTNITSTFTGTIAWSDASNAFVLTLTQSNAAVEGVNSATFVLGESYSLEGISIAMDGNSDNNRKDYLSVSNMTISKVVEATTIPTVPEPATATLSLLALAGLAMRRRRK